MLRVKVPTPDFVIATLRAGERAKCEGAFLLIARRFDDLRDSEIRRSWCDLDDLTHNDLLVLTVGLQTNDHLVFNLSEHQRAVFSPEVGGVFQSGSLPKAFESLWEYADYIPYLGELENSQDALFDSHGVTEIRRALGIQERQLPALCVLNYRARTGYLIELGTDLSPVAFISSVAAGLQDIPWRLRELEHELKHQYGYNSEYDALTERIYGLRDEISRTKDKIENRILEYEWTLKRTERALHDAPDSIMDCAQTLFHYLKSATLSDAEVENCICAIEKCFNDSRPTRTRKLPKHLRNLVKARKKSGALNDIQKRLDMHLSKCTDRLKEAETMREQKYPRTRMEIFEEIRHLQLETQSALEEAITISLKDLGLQFTGQKIPTSNLVTIEDFRVYGRVNQTIENQVYDVALSFAGDQRNYVSKVAEQLQDAGLSVFFDSFERVRLWGKSLYEHLDEVYRIRSRYCVMFISEAYGNKVWTTHERRSAQARALKEQREYILPVRFDDTEIPGLLDTIAYVDARKTAPEEVADLVREKVKMAQ